MYPSVIISKNICFTTISDEGTIESPIGVKFIDSKTKKGLLPNILETLMKDREETKKKMKEAKTPEEKQYYDGLQNAIKIYMNSFYGVFASSFYRFTDKHIGASVTAFSRETTKGIISDIESKGNKVLYSDTDSIFVKSPIDALEGSIEFGKNLAALYSKEGGQLEFEKIFESMFSHGKKKRYVGKTAWPKVDMVIRGYEIRRTDSFDIQSDTMMDVFNKILDNNIEAAIKTAKDTVQEVLKGKVDVNKLIISKGCKVFGSYSKPDTQSTVQTAKKLQALGYEFIPGMKVSWIVTDAKVTPQEVTPFIQGKTFEALPDWKYYAERVAQTLARITEVYGVTAKDLMAGNIQASLSDSFEKGAKKKYTITDYM
jgi:DNA polymerase I